MPEGRAGERGVPYLQMNDGNQIPQLGLGVFQVGPDETERVVSEAFEVGYRHVDTAQMYHNESGVGAAIASSGLGRSEIFITSKLANGNHEPKDAGESIEGSLAAMSLDYIDLFLIHWPMPTKYDGAFERTWEVLVEQREAGRLRSIGLSNFESSHLDRIAANSSVAPAVDQIEAHPYFAQDQLREDCSRRGVLVEAWAPIAQGRVLQDPAILAVARQTSRSAAQVVLRWHVQRGDIVFPKASSRAHMEENIT
ncbi:MAG: aldo/keto reductase, partial [Acidimicrobiales bacterium]